MILSIVIAYFVIGIIFVGILNSDASSMLPTPLPLFLLAVVFWPFIAYGLAAEYYEYWKANRK